MAELTSWFVNGGDPITTYDTWNDPPSTQFADIFLCDRFSESNTADHVMPESLR